MALDLMMPQRSEAKKKATGKVDEERLLALIAARESLHQSGLRDYAYSEGLPSSEELGLEDPEEGAMRRRLELIEKGALKKYIKTLQTLVRLGKAGSIEASLDGKAVELSALEGLIQPVEIMEVGRFESQGPLWVSDPCYGIEDAGAIIKDGKGVWRALALRVEEGDWGPRCARLMIVRDEPGVEPLEALSASGWKKIGDCSVDSGQAGFFDREARAKRDEKEVESAYRACCDVTLSAPGAGVVKSGAVSSSGLGDGGYAIKELRREGRLVAARVDFLTLSAEAKKSVEGAWARHEAQLLERQAKPAGGARKKAKGM